MKLHEIMRLRLLCLEGQIIIDVSAVEKVGTHEWELDENIQTT
jgi:hypothetical protein